MTQTRGLGASSCLTQSPSSPFGERRGGGDGPPWLRCLARGRPFLDMVTKTFPVCGRQGGGGAPQLARTRGLGASPCFEESPSFPCVGRGGGRRPPLPRPRDWGVSPDFMRSPHHFSMTLPGVGGAKKAVMPPHSVTSPWAAVGLRHSTHIAVPCAIQCGATKHTQSTEAQHTHSEVQHGTHCLSTHTAVQHSAGHCSAALQNTAHTVQCRA